jgi:hypothetical protein
MMRRKLAAIIAALVLIAIVAILMTTTTTKTTSTAPRPHHASTAACDAGPADDTTPTAPPADLAWKNLGPVLVPTSAAYGPTRYNQDLWTCYRHDPMGAVLAAYEIAAAVITDNWHQVAEAQIVPGQGQQTFIRATEQQTLQPPQPDQVAQPVGFQVISYTPQQATVESLADAGNGQYQAVENTVAWSGGDWKLLLSPDGSGGTDPQMVNSTNGFILWGGQNG